jgi:sulfite reductase (ferredoxin)
VLLACLQRPHVTAARDFNGFGTNFVGSPEPIYGAQYLPRKFKVLCCSWRVTSCMRTVEHSADKTLGLRTIRLVTLSSWQRAQFCLQVGVTVPGDNSIDVLTNDVAVVVISNDAGEVEVRCGLVLLQRVTLYSGSSSEVLPLQARS